MKIEKIITMLRGVITFLIPQLKKEDSIVGVKETKEALIAINAITLFLVKRFKDGVDVADAFAIIKKVATDEDPEFKALIAAGYDNYKAIKVEAKDIDGGEALELVDVQLAEIPKFLEALAEEDIVEIVETPVVETPVVE